MMTPSIPSPDFGGMIPSVERTTLPFNAKRDPSEAVILHVKILSPDANERLEVARMIQAQLAEQRVGAKGVVVLISDEEVTSELSPIAPIVQMVASQALKVLGIKSIGA